jgi:serine/threonine protein kinase
VIVLDKSTNTVVKSLHGNGKGKATANEKQIYERLSANGGHPGLLHYHGPFETGIRLEFAPVDLRSYLQTPDRDFGIEQTIRWAKQIAHGLRHVHENNVIHGNLTCRNILLDPYLNTKLIDFASSSLDESPLLGVVTASHRYPGLTPSCKADIFALGSTFFEIMTDETPYAELTDNEIAARYAKGRLPKTELLGPMGHVIMNCWRGRYDSCEDVIRDIDGM